jgi:hypothetical protein
MKPSKVPSTFRSRYLEHPVHQRWVRHWEDLAANTPWAKNHPREAYFIDRIWADLQLFNAHFQPQIAKKLVDTCQRALHLKPELDGSTVRTLESFGKWIALSGRVPRRKL